MVLQEYENTLSEYTKTSQFTTKLKTLQEQLPAILDDFKKYYLFYNVNPENQEYQRMFENIKSNLNHVNSELFTLSNDVQNETDGVNKQLFSLDVLIKKEKSQNKKLKKSLGIAEHQNNAAGEMIDDYTDIYNTGYLRNWAIFLSILVAGATISTTFRKSGV
jgi:hypothetical protein